MSFLKKTVSYDGYWSKKFGYEVEPEKSLRRKIFYLGAFYREGDKITCVIHAKHTVLLKALIKSFVTKSEITSL